MLNHARIFPIVFNILVVLSLIFCNTTSPVYAANNDSLQVEGLLNSDGTLRLNTGYIGNLDIADYGVSLDPTHGPIFKPMAVSDAWNALGNGLNAQVTSIVVNGWDIYVGGLFSDAGGVANADYIAKWNGTTWSAIGTGLNGYVNSIAISGSDIYVGGAFTNAGGVANADYIARFSGGAWSALGDGLNEQVTAIAISGTDVYAGGHFTNAGGVANADYIARFSSSTWSALGSTPLNNFVFAIAISGSNVYVGGQFTDAGGVANADAIAMWNGATWSALDTGLNGYVNTIAVAGDVYAGGSFSLVGSGDYVNIAKFSTGYWSALGTGVNGLVFDIILGGWDVYVGGFFTDAGGVPNADYIARYNGGTWSALGETPLGTSVYAIASSGSDIYAGGNFLDAGGNVNGDNIAKFELLPVPITVNTAADELNADGDCSLREAIQSAETILGADACIGGSNLSRPDTILFSDTLGTTTITLLSNLPAITSTDGLTINGGGDITVSGNGSYRPFTVSSGGLFTLNSLTVTNGFGSAYGGGLANNGGTVTITNSTFFENSAGGSGAVDNNGGTVVITNSTFSGNTATSDRGGGIYNYNGTLTIRNSTFSDNGATFSNGGTIANHNGTLNMYNTILANSVPGVDCYKVSGTVVGDHNLIETDGAGGNACGTTAPINGIDPQLGTLTSSPAYFPLNTGSPAINTGNDAICAASPVSNISQNGVTRPQGIHCDIGAYELFFYKLLLPLILR